MLIGVHRVFYLIVSATINKNRYTENIENTVKYRRSLERLKIIAILENL